MIIKCTALKIVPNTKVDAKLNEENVNGSQTENDAGKVRISSELVATSALTKISLDVRLVLMSYCC